MLSNCVHLNHRARSRYFVIRVSQKQWLLKYSCQGVVSVNTRWQRANKITYVHSLSVWTCSYRHVSTDTCPPITPTPFCPLYLYPKNLYLKINNKRNKKCHKHTTTSLSLSEILEFCSTHEIYKEEIFPQTVQA